MKKNYLVSYDLMENKSSAFGEERQGRYDKIINAIKNYGDVRKVLYSQWFIRTNETSVEIRDKLSKALDQNDKLLVVEVQDWASNNLMEVGSWLNER